MSKNRLEAFSDGVIAIIITIMVLELQPPHGTEVADLLETLPGWLRYALSFVYVGIYWVNHHALLDRVAKVDGAALWANLHLLFWMSLIPWVTAWAGEHPMAPVPVALYGVVLLLCSISFMLLSWRLDVDARHAMAWGSRKNRISILLYALAVVLSLWYPPLGALIHVLLAILWLMPEGRVLS
ncbi:TMEM175 family protein [Massilia sp. IC2-477]|uniref:TMEM175 family protein n=1 Tax=unclassified Massilia TaxID=2609279 RepID=UPI001D12341A|nr:MULTISPECIES: TMEM175 family protein [unclassified Massilia]MCC2955154.1 TMEM175 family protein [Massilia sp. IC2-477]MCC2974627.1 TMEM175 family protein [Massilia sp. IC2-476]